MESPPAKAPAVLSTDSDSDSTPVAKLEGRVVNASGHPDKLQREYGVFSICALAINIDNAWEALGASLVVAISNGGPPGVLYEYIVACIYYCFIGASIAELASAIPSAGGVYHYACITPGPRLGRFIGFMAGFINFFGWLFTVPNIAYVLGVILLEFYSLYNPDYVLRQGHLAAALICVFWFCLALTVFGKRILPYIQHFGSVMILGGGFITIIVIASMTPKHASHSFVWTDFNNVTGWSNGVAFLAGCLNGAFTIGTPDAVTHLAEDLPNPKKDLPRAIAAQIGFGTLYGFFFAVAICYGINDLDKVLNAPTAFPLTEIYFQGTGGNRGATFGLLMILFLATIVCLVGVIQTISRIWFALARDNATPFPHFFSYVHPTLSCPIPATILVGLISTALGCIAVANKTAFNDLVGSFIVLTTASYALAIIPHILTGRRNVPPGYFWMGRTCGFIVNGLAVFFIVFFDVFYCFPFVYPVADVSSMNYNSVILFGVVVLTWFWWGVGGIWKFEKPKVVVLYEELRAEGRAGGLMPKV